MSTRSASGPGSTRTPIFSPPSSSPAASFRKHRLPSGSITPFTDYYRRPSGAQARKYSQTSASGTSTPFGPNAPTKKRKESAVPEGETDWSSLDADEVFRRLPVGEVKRVEAKMRNDALNKQSELRSMVGSVKLLSSKASAQTVNGTDLQHPVSRSADVCNADNSPPRVLFTALFVATERYSRLLVAAGDWCVRRSKRHERGRGGDELVAGCCAYEAALGCARG